MGNTSFSAVIMNIKEVFHLICTLRILTATDLKRSVVIMVSTHSQCSAGMEQKSLSAATVIMAEREIRMCLLRSGFINLEIWRFGNLVINTSFLNSGYL